MGLFHQQTSVDKMANQQANQCQFHPNPNRKFHIRGQPQSKDDGQNAKQTGKVNCPVFPPGPCCSNSRRQNINALGTAKTPVIQPITHKTWITFTQIILAYIPSNVSLMSASTTASKACLGDLRFASAISYALR